jgi:hypothetical protein
MFVSTSYPLSRTVDSNAQIDLSMISHDIDGPKFLFLESRPNAPPNARNLFDHLRQPPAFVSHDLAITPELVRIANDSIRKIFTGRADHREWGPELVAHRRDELHLLLGQSQWLERMRRHMNATLIDSSARMLKLIARFRRRS